MKKKMISLIKSILTTGATLVLLVLFTQGCKSGSSDPSPLDEVKANLASGAWKLQNVAVDGVDKTSTYAGLTLTFNAANYSSTNGRVIWPATGTWKFSDDTGKSITRDDNLVIGITEVTSSKLVLTLTWSKTTLGTGRVASTKGNHVFTFGK